MKKKITSVSVILPTYNEAENIVPLITDILSVLSAYKTDIVVVDDNSPDGTSQRVRHAITDNRLRSVSILTRTRNRGLTNSIRDGIRHTKADIIVWMDCDFSHPPSLLLSLVSGVEKGFDAAVGSRFVPSGKQKNVNKGQKESRLAVILSTALNRCVSVLLGNNFHDYTSGFIAVKRNVLFTIPLRGDYGEYFIDFMYIFFSKGYKALEIPYTSLPRRFGESKTGANTAVLFGHGIQYIGMIGRLMVEKIMGNILL